MLQSGEKMPTRIALLNASYFVLYRVPFAPESPSKEALSANQRTIQEKNANPISLKLVAAM